MVNEFPHCLPTVLSNQRPRLCIDADTDRPVQSALANVLQEVTEICPLTPVVVVGTKKDKYLLFNRGHMNETELLSAREAMFRQKFSEEPETSPFWPVLKAQFAFVSKGSVHQKHVTV